MIRQGDILFIPIATIPVVPDTSFKRTVRTSGIIAEGEATGHHHRIADVDLPVAELVDIGRSWGGEVSTYLSVTDHGISIVHEEHGTVILPPGTYKVHQAREYDYMSQFSRAVRD